MFIVYKIINNINNKYYIGVHKTVNINDNYYGSGIAIKNAIRKYGKSNFTKEVLYIFDNNFDAYKKEKELTINYIDSDNYNMRIGGVGGFTKEVAKKGYQKVTEKYENFSTMGGVAAHKKGKSFGGENSKNDPVECGRKGGLKNKGKPKSEEHKKKLSESFKNRMRL